MDNKKSKKKIRKTMRKTVFGIKLPPIGSCDANDIKTIVDVDPGFFTMVDGRPIRPNTSYHAYKQNIRDITLKRTLHGFLRDEILRIDREINEERRIFENASKHFDEYQNSFDKFLADDNNKTIAIMKKSDSLAKELTNEIEEHRQANFELASVKSKLQYIDDTLLILLSFQNFLHKAAPVLWQQSNDVELDVVHEEVCSMENDVFKVVNIDAVKDRLSKFPPPRLYFKTPEQILDIFYLLEKQNLNYLLVTEELNCQKNKFLKVLVSLKKMLTNELNFIEIKIKELEMIIQWNEMRESDLKEVFFRILEQKMQELIVSDTALQVFNYVEFAYEQLIAPNEIKLSSYEMTRALESEYNNLMLDLSAFDLDILKQTEKEAYENEVKEMRQAEEANKLLKDVDKLNKRLKSSFEPSRKRTDI